MKHLQKKSKTILNYIVGPLLFIILAFIIYTKIKNQPNLHEKIIIFKSVFTLKNIWKLTALFVLLCANWGIESRKWQLLMKPVESVSFLTSVKAILSGLALSLFLPNGFGEYPARALYMKEGNRLRSVALNIAGSMAQLIITLIAGLLSLTYLRNYTWQKQPQMHGLSFLWLDGIISMITLGTILLIIIYFRLSWLTQLFEKIPFVYKYKLFIQSLETFHWKELTRILYLSFLRFLVFVVQYIIVLQLFHVKISVTDAVCTTCVLFLILAILPTIPFADIGIRSEAGSQLFGLITPDIFGVVATTSLVWFVNLIIPSIAGSLFLLNVKIFGKQHIK